MLHLQASFDPPGLTIAVKKDRAVESLLNAGDKFVLNILAEGSHKQLMKQLLKPFKPGEDRFAGLDVQVGSKTSPACVKLLQGTPLVSAGIVGTHFES